MEDNNFDFIQQYLTDIGKFPLLSPNEEIELFSNLTAENKK